MASEHADLPPPLVPSDADLSGYEFMPLYGDRLRASDLNCRVSDAEFRAAVNLWWSAWKQVPAASLPNDDAALCKLADLGRDLRAWRKVKALALANFQLCSDGRLYHTFLAGEAIKAWDARKKQRAKGLAGNEKRWGRVYAVPIAAGIAQGSHRESHKDDSGDRKGQESLSNKSFVVSNNSAPAVDKSPPGFINSNSTQKAAAHSIANAQAAIREIQAAKETAVTEMPEFARRYVKHNR